MSNTMTKLALGSISDAQPDTARLRFGFRRQDLDVQAQLAASRDRGIRARSPRRGRPPWRPAAGAGRCCVRACWRRPCSASMVRSMAADDKRPDAPDAFAQTDDARKGIDHAKPAARRPGQEQAAVVGAEIERAINGAAALPIVLGTVGAGPAPAWNVRGQTDPQGRRARRPRLFSSTWLRAGNR